MLTTTRTTGRTTGRVIDWLKTWHPAEMAEADLAGGGGLEPLPAAPAGAPVPEPGQAAAVRDATGRFTAPGQQATDAAVQQAAQQLDGIQQPVANPWDGKTPEQVWQHGETFKADLDRVKGATKDYREVSQALGPDNSAALVAFGRAFASGDLDAVAEFHASLGEILAQSGKGAPAPAGQQAPEFDPFQPEQIDQRVNQTVEAALAKRDAQAAQDRAIETVRSHMKGLSAAEGADGSGGVGIPELGDPQSWQYKAVLSIAQGLTDGDPTARLTNAAQTFRDEIGKAGQALLTTKRQQTVAPASPTNGAAPSGRQEPTTMTDARRSAEERLRQRESFPS